MKNSFVAAVCWLAVCASAAFSQATAGGKDQQFINSAAQTDMMEAHVGQLAKDHGGSQAVKDFGQMLVTDHTNDYGQLSTIAKKDGASVPRGLDAVRNRMIAPYERLHGAAFDRKFAADMVAGHQRAIAEYRREIRIGQNPDIKAYANQALPVLEKHLQAARDLTGRKASKAKARRKSRSAAQAVTPP